MAPDHGRVPSNPTDSIGSEQRVVDLQQRRVLRQTEVVQRTLEVHVQKVVQLRRHARARVARRRMLLERRKQLEELGVHLRGVLQRARLGEGLEQLDVARLADDGRRDERRTVLVGVERAAQAHRGESAERRARRPKPVRVICARASERCPLYVLSDLMLYG